MKKGHLLLLIAIIALGAFLRFYDTHETPLGLYPDEAMNGNNALEATATGEFKFFYPENNGREGLFINIQAVSLAIFGNEPWALRIVSALFGTLTILGIYLLTRELLNSQTAALLSAFFLATSYWHINFSRIGFRAIMVPFFATFAMYFLLKGIRKGAALNLILAGIFAGLGLHTYIAFRFMAFAFLVPIIWYLWQWRKKPTTHKLQTTNSSCIPCAILLFIFVAFVVALPLGVYFAQHPAQFINRADEISIFSAQSPLKEFGKSTLFTLGMFFVRGDCNWRHNFNCQPQLHPIISIFVLVGLITAARAFFRKSTNYQLPTTTLLVWLGALMLPSVLTREGLPHALRSIGMIPPVMILASWGAVASWRRLQQWFATQQQKWPLQSARIKRIQKELIILALLLLLIIPLATYRDYFLRWADHSETYAAFDTSSLHLGQFLNSLPTQTKKYVIVNTLGVQVRGIPMPAQSVMFVTNTFRDEKRREKNLFYLTRADADRIEIPDAGDAMVALIDGGDRDLIRNLRQRLPAFRTHAPGDFIILQNY